MLGSSAYTVGCYWIDGTSLENSRNSHFILVAFMNLILLLHFSPDTPLMTQLKYLSVEFCYKFKIFGFTFTAECFFYTDVDQLAV